MCALALGRELTLHCLVTLPRGPGAGLVVSMRPAYVLEHRQVVLPGSRSHHRSS